jgi:hypothetical protein
MIDNSLQTSICAQIHCKCVKHIHEAGLNETLIFSTSILSRILALFRQKSTSSDGVLKPTFFLHHIEALAV